jgi:microcompartment protein CcmL/EutN
VKYALGIIETVGLAAGIQAADAAVKSANVRLIGYELTKGDGMATIKIEGDVGAVKAAIDAARMSASLVSKVHGYRVIPRPSDGLEMLIRNESTVGYQKESPPQARSTVDAKDEATEVLPEEAPSETLAEIDSAVNEAETEVAAPIAEAEAISETVSEVKAEAVAEVEAAEVAETLESAEADSEASEEYFDAEETDSEDDEVCNICKDPKCTRKKGELRRFCIHYYDNK